MELYVLAKLTLRVPEELVVAAKAEAANRNVSLSKLVTDYFINLATKKPNRNESDQLLAPKTNSLAGCISSSEKSAKQDYIDYLENY